MKTQLYFLKLVYCECVTHIDQAIGITVPEGRQHRGIVQVGHVGHVLAADELGGVHHDKLVLGNILGLQNVQKEINWLLYIRKKLKNVQIATNLTK